MTCQNSDLITAEQAQHGAQADAIEKAICCIEDQLKTCLDASSGKPYILFIDSKGALDEGALRVVERLGNYQVDGRHIMNCVVFHNAARNVERYAAVSDMPFRAHNHFWLRRLTLCEINEYLRHHMMLFDFNRRDLFSREMAYFIADRSEGVFKSINTLARNAFTIANLEEADKLSMSHLLMAGLPVPDEQAFTGGFLARHRRATVAFVGLTMVALMAFFLSLL